MRSKIIINAKGLSATTIAKIREIGKLTRKEFDPNMPRAYYRKRGNQFKITGWPEFIKLLQQNLKAYFYRKKKMVVYERICQTKIT